MAGKDLAEVAGLAMGLRMRRIEVSRETSRGRDKGKTCSNRLRDLDVGNP